MTKSVNLYCLLVNMCKSCRGEGRGGEGERRGRGGEGRGRGGEGLRMEADF